MYLLTNKTHIDDHEARLLLLEYKSVDLEARSRRKNLLFRGFSEERGENCATLITNFLRQSLGIAADVCIDRAHRLGVYKHDKNRQIIVAFSDYKDVQDTMANASKLKGSKFSINRDYPQEIVNARKKLWNEYKSLKSEHPDKRVSLVYPAKLLLNGRVIRDAFPHWSEMMKGNRISDKQSRVNNTVYTARESRASHSNNSPTRSNSTSSVSSVVSNSRSQPSNQHIARRRSRSHTRRGHARTPHRNSQHRERSTSSNLAAASRSTHYDTDGNDPSISRPWDSPGATSKRQPRTSAR